MARAAAVLLSFVVVVSGATAARSLTSAPAGYEMMASTSLYTGVEYGEVARAKGPVVAHVAHVIPGAPVDLRVVSANGKVPRNTQELETTSSICRRVQCVVGVNGDFHKGGVPVGAVVVDGRLLRSPDPARSQLTVTGDGHLTAGAFPWTGSLTTGAAAPLPVGAVNAAPPANGLAVFTPDYGPATAASSHTELVVRAAEPVGALNRPADLQPVSLRAGAGPIPADGAVLSGDGPAGQQLRDLWARSHTGATSPVRLLLSSPLDARFSLGVEPVVLRNGRPAPPSADPNLVNPHQPHTLVGWNPNGDTYLVAVDGRRAGSVGVTMAEAADFLLGLGVTDAVSLDGGGGTTFVAGGSVWNHPSDADPAHPGQYIERGTANAFMITARPDSPAPTASPTPPAAVADPLSALKELLTGPAADDLHALTADPAPAGGDDPAPPPAAGLDGDSVLGQLTGLGGDLNAAAIPVPLSSTGSRRRSQPGNAVGHEQRPAGANEEEGPPAFPTQPSTRRTTGAPSTTAPDGDLQQALSPAGSFPSAPTGTPASPPDLGTAAAIAAVAALAALFGIAFAARRKRLRIFSPS